MSDAGSGSEPNRSLRRRLEERSNEDLVAILRERDENEWRPEVFDLVASILADRNVSVDTAEHHSGREGDVEGEADPDSSSLVTIRRYFSPLEAHADRAALDASGLQAWVADEAAGTNWGVGIGARLQVRSEDEAAARAMLETAAVADPEHGPGEFAGDDPNEGGPPPVEEAGEKERVALAREETFRAVDLVEVTGVLLFACAYPIAQNLWGRAATSSEPVALNALWYCGLTLIGWTLVRRGTLALEPRRLPTSLLGWGREMGAGLLLFLVVWAAVNPLAHRLLSAVGVPESTVRGGSFQGMLASPGWARFSLLFGAAYEEVFFRAYLVSRLSALLGGRAVWAVIVAASVFALYHGYPAMSTLVVFAGAVVVGAVYVRTRSVPRLVFAHWIYNTTILSAELARHSTPS